MPKQGFKNVQARLMPREDVERLAQIVGENSAARKALDAAKRYTDPVFLSYGGSLFVTERRNVQAEGRES